MNGKVWYELLINVGGKAKILSRRPNFPLDALILNVLCWLLLPASQVGGSRVPSRRSY